MASLLTFFIKGFNKNITQTMSNKTQSPDLVRQRYSFFYKYEVIRRMRIQTQGKGMCIIPLTTLFLAKYDLKAFQESKSS